LNKPTVLFAILCLVFVVFFLQCTQNNSFPILKGDYLGQNSPGMKPALFAPGLISTGLYERDLALRSDGKEMFYGIIIGGQATIMMTRIINNSWTEPEVAPFATNRDFHYFEPCLSPDGKRLFFLSTLPPSGEKAKPGWGHQNIWMVHRTDDGDWGEPQDLGFPVNTQNEEYFPSITSDGTLYFTRSVPEDRTVRIMRSRNLDGAYQEPEPLPGQINGHGRPYNAYIAPDESFLIACVEEREDCVTPGFPDYYVFFRRPDDTWSEGINLGQEINMSGDRALSPYVSPDGEYFFFSSARRNPEFFAVAKITWSRIQHIHAGPQNGSSDIYWVDARIIENLRPEAFE